MAPHEPPHGAPWAPLRFFSFGLRFFFRLPVLISVGCFCGFQVMLSHAATDLADRFRFNLYG